MIHKWKLFPYFVYYFNKGSDLFLIAILLIVVNL